MSIDTYFCFCCLSTNELTSLYSNDSSNFAHLLQSLFNISISLEDYEYDGHICKDCADGLSGIQKFKTQVFETLSILQNNGLIEISNEKDLVKVKRIQETFLEIEEKNVIEQASQLIVSLEEIIEEKPKIFQLNEDTPQKIYLHNIVTPIKTKSLERDKIKTERQRQTEPLIRDNIKRERDSETESFKSENTKTDRNCGTESLKRDNQTKSLEKDNTKKKRDRQIQSLERGNTKKESDKHTLEVTQYKVPADLKCTECGLVLPNIYTYHTHMNEHYPNHICEACGKGFLTEKRLKRHQPSHKTGPFKCQVCDVEFSNYNTLNSHRQRKHSSVELYKCPYCAERFSTFTRRAVHLAANHHYSTGKYECKICNRRFLISGNLSHHVRRAHAPTRPHACATCGAQFPHRRDLLAHSNKHQVDKLHQCALCGKKYPRKKALVVHMRTHTGEKRFACEVCGKRFLQKCTLLVHAKTHNRKAEKKTVETESVEYTFVKWSEENCT